MEELKKLSRSALVDLLNQKTNEYIKMLREGTTQENFEACKAIIGQLTTEIENRKKVNENYPGKQ